LKEHSVETKGFTDRQTYGKGQKRKKMAETVEMLS
jgi:hypothetical protein